MRSAMLFVVVMVAGCQASRDAAENSATDAAAGTDERADAGHPVPDPQAACVAMATQPADAVWTLDVGGTSREARVHVPASYDPATRTPVVLSFHGVNTNASQQEYLSQLLDKSDESGFVVVHPQGLGNSWNGGSCCGSSASDDVDDIGFVRALLDDLEATLCVDATRVFATGMSNGGYMTHRIGCELADRIAAIAPVAGGNLMAVCEPVRPISMMHFHGTADSIVPYHGNAGLPAATETFEDWAKRDGCVGTPVETFANGDSHCETYQACEAGSEVTLCTVEGGGHTWPGGTPVPFLGATTDDLDADAAMWEFFRRHPLP